MSIASHTDDWPSVLGRVSSIIDLDVTARESKALLRCRGVRHASDLLRLALAYGPGGQSLREASAWALLQGIGSLSSQAVMNRLRGASDWLEVIAGRLLAEASSSALAAGRRVRAVDASVIPAPGSGKNWRLHAVYELREQRFSHLELTDIHGAEGLERVPVETNDVVLGDRVFARPDGLRHVVDGGGDFVVRLGSRSLSLQDPDGAALDLMGVLAESARAGSADLPVLIGHGRKRDWKPLPARLIVLPKPPEAAERARQKAQRASQRGGHQNDPASLEAAGYLMLITSLPDNAYPAASILDLYRTRWQIELAFKRLKSLLRIDHLPAKDPALARAWILAHLIVAAIIDDISPDFRDSPPSEQQ